MGKLYTILFKVPELQRKILMTAMFLAIYRIGFYIPLPIVDQTRLADWQNSLAKEGLGRIVGNPTAAAVIATGSYTLINGGAIRTPGSLVVTYDPTKPNNWGVNLENLGVPPDVWVKNTPMDELKKTDRELKAAIDEAMRMLRETRPKVSTR